MVKSAVLAAVVFLGAATPALAAAPPAGGPVIAQRICTQIQTEVGSVAYGLAYGKSGCAKMLDPKAEAVIRTCLGKHEPSTAAWRSCIDAHIKSTARSAAKVIAHSAAKQTTATTPTPAPPAEQTGNRQIGTITALSPTSITVGTLTCAIESSSAIVGDYKVGDRAGIFCSSGVLKMINTPPN